MGFSFIWELTEDYSQRDSSEELLRLGGVGDGGRGEEVHIHVTFGKGVYAKE